MAWSRAGRSARGPWSSATSCSTPILRRNKRAFHVQTTKGHTMSELLSRPELDRLLLGSPLRRRGYAIAVSAALAIALIFAVLMTLLVVGGLRPDVARVFFTALGVSTVASLAPIVILRFLDLREREATGLFAAA